MIKRQRIMQELEAVLKTITIANGYNTNIGNKVYEYRETDIADAELPCLLYRDSDDIIEITHNLALHTLICEITAIEQAGTGLLRIRNIVADVKRAIQTRRAGIKDTYFSVDITPPPIIVTSVIAGTLPAGTYFYQVVAFLGNVFHTAPSVEVSQVLTAVGGVRISWNAVAGATRYVIYGRQQGNRKGWITHLIGLFHNDTGSIIPDPTENLVNVFDTTGNDLVLQVVPVSVTTDIEHAEKRIAGVKITYQFKYLTFRNSEEVFTYVQ